MHICDTFNAFHLFTYGLYMQIS